MLVYKKKPIGKSDPKKSSYSPRNTGDFFLQEKPNQTCQLNLLLLKVPKWLFNTIFA